MLAELNEQLGDIYENGFHGKQVVVAPTISHWRYDNSFWVYAIEGAQTLVIAGPFMNSREAVEWCRSPTCRDQQADKWCVE